LLLPSVDTSGDNPYKEIPARTKSKCAEGFLSVAAEFERCLIVGLIPIFGDS
jgi:hypothetical protein